MNMSRPRVYWGEMEWLYFDNSDTVRREVEWGWIVDYGAKIQFDVWQDAIEHALRLTGWPVRIEGVSNG